MTEHGLGRLEPTDFKHIEQYPLRMVGTPTLVEKTLKLPHAYRPKYDQGQEGACVGFAWSWAASILNRTFYDAFWLYYEAQRNDEWPGEEYSGTSIRAGGDVLRKQGHRLKHKHDHEHETELAHGIERFEWATSVDQIRMCIATGKPVVLGMDWFTTFDRPVKKKNEYWIGEGNLGQIRGGHAICCYGASDKRQAVKLVNSWGKKYPLVYLPYTTLERLLAGFQMRGEATIITDRI
jgi:hypothetical protein